MCFVLVYLCLWLFLQMSPIKQSASKKSSKRPRTDSENFRSIEVDMACKGFSKKAPDHHGKGCSNGDPWKHFHFESIQRKDMDKDKVAEPKWECLCRDHKGILCKCYCGRGTHQLLAAGERVLCHEGIYPRDIESLSTDSIISYPIWWYIRPFCANCRTSWWWSQKEGIEHSSFHLGMRTLAYIMLHDLYSIKNLTTLLGPRAIFLLNLFTHKEIDICSHIYYLFTKCITKRNSRMVLPFLSLIMAFIARARVKLPSGLSMMPMDYPISAQTMTRSKAHITGPSIGIS